MGVSLKIRLIRTARKAKARAIRFKQAERPVLVFGLRRGGSTMVADAIAVNHGVWTVNEPFAVLPNHRGYGSKQKNLPAAEHSHYFLLDGAAQEKFERYANGLLGARFRNLGTSRHTKPGLRADRVSLKILNAPWMVDWFADNTDAHILPVLRHPGAQAVSTLRQNWQFPVEAYLHRKTEIAPFFTAPQLDMMDEIWASGDRWQIAILDFAICSKPIRARFKDRVIKYEDIVQDPETFVHEVLVGQCNLPEAAAMLASLQKPSNSSRMSLDGVNKAILARDVDAILTAWRRDVTPEMEASGQRILDVFEIDQFRFFEG